MQIATAAAQCHWRQLQPSDRRPVHRWASTATFACVSLGLRFAVCCSPRGAALAQALMLLA
eukprot:6767732-Alexandrium_andersonii.AAC.1